MIQSLTHLVDDSTVGGVNRMLQFLERCPELANTSRHSIELVRRGRWTTPKLTADMIVSNLAVSWANLPLFTALRAAYPKTRLVHIEHSYSERFVTLNVRNRDRFETLLRSVYALFDHVVAVSEQQAKWMRRKNLCPQGRLTVIEPLTDLNPFVAIPDLRPGDRRIVGAIGRLDNQKGFDILIEAFRRAELPAVELHIHGDGASMGELKVLAGGKTNIVFKGFANDPAAAMAGCDLVAMPSRWEPYGLVALEAMAAGRPVICARVDGLATHISAGAIDVGENTPDGWAARLRRLDQLALPAAAVRGRCRANVARTRFVGAWDALIAGDMNPETADALAA